MERRRCRARGVRFANRPDGKAREVVGVGPAVMDLFSSRRRAITAKLAGWVDEMRRNATRLGDAKADIAVGKISGPVGTHASVPRSWCARASS